MVSQVQRNSSRPTGSPHPDPTAPPTACSIEPLLESAEAALKAKNWSQAIAQAQQAIQLQPTAKAYRLLGNAHLHQKQWQAAQIAYEQALQLQPDSAEIHANLGTVAARQQRWAEALQFFRRAIALKPELPQLQQNLERLWTLIESAIGQSPEAIRAFLDQPHQFDAIDHQTLGDRLVQQGQLELAVQCYETAVAIDPGRAAAFWNLSLAQKQLGNPEAMLKAYAQAVLLQPDWATAEQHCNLGKYYLEQAQWAKAVRHYERAIEQNPTLADAQLGLGTALQKLGQLQQAIDRYEKAIELEPEGWLAYHNLGGALLAQKQWLQAIAAYQQAIALKPNYSWSHHNLGDALKSLGQWQEAIAAYQQAIALNPDFHWSHYNLGEVFASLEQWDAAIEAYQRALDMKPDLAEATLKLCQALNHRAKADSERILAYYREAIQQDPDNLDLLHQAIEFQPSNPEFYRGLTQALARNNQLDQARVFEQMTLHLAELGKPLPASQTHSSHLPAPGAGNLLAIVPDASDRLPDLFQLKISPPHSKILAVSFVRGGQAAGKVEQYLQGINEQFDYIALSPAGKLLQTSVCPHALCRKTVSVVYPDRYGDAASFLHLLQSGVLNQYEFVCWINLPSDSAAPQGESPAIPAETIAPLSLLRQDASIGLISSEIGSARKHDEVDVDVRRILGTLLARFGRLKPQVFPKMPTGSVIWMKNLIIQQLKALPLKPEELLFKGKLPSLTGWTILQHLLGIFAQEGGLEVLSDRKANSSQSGQQPKQNSGVKARPVKAIAFYLPQFHPIPENDRWWGKGFTEWTNVVRGKALFRNHYQPRLPADLGYYDLRLPETQAAQAALAKAYGIHGFCYYYYWFNGKKLLSTPIEQMLQSGQPDFPFCLCWANENWSRNWDGQNRHVLMEQGYSLESNRALIQEIIPMMQDQRYIRHHGKPILLVYRIKVIPNWLETAQMWREECRRAGVGEIHLCAVRFGLEPLTGQPGDLGLDAYVLFPPHESDRVDVRKDQLDLHKDFRGEVLSYDAVVEGDLKRFSQGYSWAVHRGAMMGWDNTARRLTDARIFVGATPMRLHYWLKEILAQEAQFNPDDESLLFINAWNEWAEGTFLEPDQRFGTGYLEAVKSAIATSANLRSDRSIFNQSVNPVASSLRTEKIQHPQWHPGKRELRSDVPSILLCAHISGHQLFGGERSFLDVLSALSKINLNVFVTLPSANNKSYIAAIQESVAGIYTFSYPQWIQNRAADELIVLMFAKIIAKHNIQLVHANTIVLLEPLLAARRMNRIPLVHARELITLDDSLRERIGLPTQDIIHRVFSSTDYVIANSRTTEAIFQREGRTFYAPNVVNLDDFDLKNPVSGAIRFAIVSSNIPKKGVADFIEVARLYESQMQNQSQTQNQNQIQKAEFLVIGPENEQIIAWQNQQKQGLIPSNIKFLGYCESPCKAMAAANVILNLSNFAESFGRTVAEAMAARRPVIAYEWGALPELVRHGVSGYLAPYRDTAAVASFVMKFCQNPELVQKMGEAGRTSIAAGFTPECLHQQLLKAYQQIFAITSFAIGQPGTLNSGTLNSGTSKPDIPSPIALPLSRRITIIIPVFNAYDEVRLCLESVLQNTDLTDAAVHVIDDGSSDPRIKDLLNQYVNQPGVKITHNSQNWGYTKTINLGIQAAGNDDIVLLNSDTIVTPRWLSGLRAAAYRENNIGTVTAMSDNAGAFSFPEQGEANLKPDHVSHADYAAAMIAATASCAAVDVPTGSGFCMYIRRELFSQIGCFDEAAFPRGYGEENDFCMRAIAAGWRNIVTPWAFVFHKRTASFKEEKAKLVQQGVDVVTRRYPDYAKQVKAAFGSAAMANLRQAAARAREEYLSRQKAPTLQR